MKYKINLNESTSYRDFIWIYDSDLGLYVVSEEPVNKLQKVVFINKTEDNKKDSIEDVIAYIDDYYDSLEDLNSYNEDLTETAESSDIFAGLYVIKLVKTDDTEEVIEFTGKDALYNAQDYIDRLKIDNDEFFKKAILVDSEKNILDSWTYSEE